MTVASVVPRRTLYARSACPYKLVEPTRWHQAALGEEWLSIGWLLQKRLGASIDHTVADRRVLRPVRHQTPAHKRKEAIILTLAHDGCKLSRGNIKARSEIVLLLVPSHGSKILVDVFIMEWFWVATTHIVSVYTTT
jgi:hypothetical protein